jgi:hypothetical protein
MNEGQTEGQTQIASQSSLFHSTVGVCVPVVFFVETRVTRVQCWMSTRWMMCFSASIVVVVSACSQMIFIVQWLTDFSRFVIRATCHESTTNIVLCSSKRRKPDVATSSVNVTTWPQQAMRETTFVLLEWHRVEVCRSAYSSHLLAFSTRVSLHLASKQSQQWPSVEVDICSQILIGLSYVLLVLTFPVSIFLCIRVSDCCRTSALDVSAWLRLFKNTNAPLFCDLAVFCQVERWECPSWAVLVTTCLCHWIGGAKGPGLFCVLPCADSIISVDLRTATFNVPPQEVTWIVKCNTWHFLVLGTDTWLGHCFGRCRCLQPRVRSGNCLCVCVCVCEWWVCQRIDIRSCLHRWSA